MSRATPLRRRAPARGEARARILEVASVLFTARGFADISMQQIADASGVTKAAMYYHFQSKEDLFAEVARQAINQFWEGIISRAETPGPLHTTLASIIDFMLTAATETVPWRLLNDIRNHLSPEVQRDLFAGHPTPDDALRNLFQRAITSGEMRPLDVDGVAALFMAMAMGIALAGRGQDGQGPRPGDDELIVDVLLHGIAAPPR